MKYAVLLLAISALAQDDITITASYGGVAKQQTIRRKPYLVSFTCSPAEVAPGDYITCTARMSKPVSVDTTVSLSATGIDWPPVAVVPAGAAEVTITVQVGVPVASLPAVTASGATATVGELPLRITSQREPATVYVAWAQGYPVVSYDPAKITLASDTVLTVASGERWEGQPVAMLTAEGGAFVGTQDWRAAQALLARVYYLDGSPALN